MPPKCPYCNEELEYTELRRSQNEGDYYYETWEGRCPQCQKDFYWDEVFNYFHCDNLEEAPELE